jgi:hypothetical protein
MYFENFQKILYDFDIEAKTGTGSQAYAVCDLAGGGINSVTVINPGLGYLSATCIFSPPDNLEEGVTATGRVVVIGGQVSSIIVLNPGTGYTSQPSIQISSPYGITKKFQKLIGMTDITQNIRFRKEILANITTYDYYDIKDGETPEILSEKIYGTPEYHWVIMLANNRYDYTAEWPLTYVTLQKYIDAKYGEDADATRHYEDENGYVVMGGYPVSNREYEERLNEKKRRIKIISPSLISTILANYKDIM